MWMLDESTFNAFHADYQNIYLVQIVDKSLKVSTATPPPLAPALQEEFPEIIQHTRYAYHSGGELLESGGHKTYAKGLEVDAAFFDMFHFPVKQGEKNSFFDQPNSILLTSDLAIRLFGKENPIGKTIKFRNEQLLVVRGVLEDIPKNSSIRFEYAVPFTTFYKGGGDEWGMWSPASFIKLAPQANKEQVAKKIKKFTKIHERKERELALFALRDIHFNLEEGAFFQNYTSYIHYQAMFLMALFILIVSCLNYVNLSIALFSGRRKEVGIKKVLGADKSMLTFQYLKEVLIQGILAVVLSLIILIVSRKAINAFAQKEMVDLFNFTHLSLFIGIGLLVVLISGIYPALVLSSFPPMSLIKRLRQGRKKTFTFRGILIVGQFTVTIILLVCSIVLSGQIGYIQNKDLGYDKNQLLAIPTYRGEIVKNYEVIKEELASLPDVKQVSLGSFRYVYFDEKVSEWEGKQDEDFMKLYAIGTDYNFAQTLGFTLQQGRFFSKEFNEEANLIINDEAAKQMGMQEPVGKQVKWRNKQYTIVGVVKNFNYWDVSKKVEPIFMFQATYGDIFVRINAANITQTLNNIAGIFTRHNPAFPFEYHFIDQEIASLYEKENRMESILFIFSGICMFLSSLGLYALSSFVLGEKLKEISIKKILGAPVYQLFTEQSMLFLKWILLACLIGVPVAIWGMDQWLSSYAYHRDIHVQDILLALLITMGVACWALLSNVLKASRKNPLDWIRVE
jgi:ABC-type antimicrobial peptide transport system permease subunit